MLTTRFQVMMLLISRGDILVPPLSTRLHRLVALLGISIILRDLPFELI
jgi:hypothetical protein